MRSYIERIASLSPEKLMLLERRAPLSFAQQRLWFLDRLRPGDPLYNIPAAVRLTGRLDAPALERSFHEVIARHDALRTVFPAFDGRPLQIVTPPQPFNLPVIDLSGMDEAEREARVQQLADAEALFRFDLAAGPLCRLTLVRLSAGEHVLFLTLHHIVGDGWSIGVLINEVAALYQAFSRGEASPLPDLPIQYADYARWQREWLRGDALEQQLDYWKRQLAGSPPVLELPTDRPRPPAPSHRGANFSFRIRKEVADALSALSRREGVTLFMTLLAAFQTLLSRYARQEDIPVGTAVAGRSRVEAEGLIGFFINTLVLRTDLSGDPTFTELLGRAREVTLGAYAHQDIPFEKLVEELQPERSASHTPLFQVMLVLQNTPEARLELPGLRLEQVAGENRTAKFDLLLTMSEGREGLGATFEYSADLFDEATVGRMAGHFGRLLEAVAADPERRLSRLSILGDGEREELLSVSGASDQFPSEACLHHLFERRAAVSPDRVALCFGGEQLTYGELNERANRLAHLLRSLGLSPLAPVALLLEPSMHTVVSLLAVLKAGLAYLPLDTAYPQERLSFMLADAGAELVLTTTGQEGMLPAQHPPVVLLDTDASISAQSAENCAAAVSADDVAYVIYTSGSTGRPKGVAVTHRNVVRLFAATEASYGFNPSDVWTLFHSYAFDFSVWEVWGALLSGGRLVVVPFLVSREPERFWRLLSEERVTVLNQTPSAFRQLIEAEAGLARAGGQESPGREMALRVVIFGGEALELQSLRPWVERHGDERPQLINMYGITETTVHVTYRRIRREDIEEGRGSVIGRAMADMELYVLGEGQELLPVGVSGEMYVGGGGLARGYLGRAGLTAGRFVPHPFSAVAGERLYRTGDLGRYLPGGDVEYLGRVDQQVKVRGFRIELGEIEAALQSHPQVRHCTVVAKADRSGEKRLVAYVVREVEQGEQAQQTHMGAEALSVTALREHLRRHLPDYMLPAAFVEIEQIPLTQNGKLDRRALPEPEEAGRIETSEQYAGPRTRAEEVLCEVWAEVLGVERVGIDDDFFALGGDSIRSVQVLARAEKRGVSFSLQQLFQYQTIRELAAEACKEEASSARPAKAAPYSLISADDREKLDAGIEDAYPVTMLQLGMLFHSAYHPEDAVYHNVNSFRLRLPFDGRAFEEAIARIVARHDVLRTSFDLTSYTEPLQLVYESVAPPLRVEDLRRLSGEEQEELLATWFEAEKQRPFDWKQAPLIRFHVHRRSDEVFQFGFTEHHAILDGWSVASMLTELFQTYMSLIGRVEQTALPRPSVEFRDFVALERAALEGEEARNYWREKLDGSTITRLPRLAGHGRVPTSGQERAGEKGFQKVGISAEVYEGLKSLAQATGSSLKSVLLAAHLRVMSLLSGQPDVMTGLVTNGRPEEADGERALGLFLNTLPLRVGLFGGTWQELVRSVFEAETEMLSHRRFPLAELQRMQGGQPLFETLFNYTHFHVYESLPTVDEPELLDQKVFAETNFTFEANFELDIRRTKIGLMLSYDPAEFTAEQVEAIGGFYSRTLSAMAHSPQQRYDHCHLLSEEELHRQLVEWNNTRTGLPVSDCIHHLFEAQVERTPDEVALVSGHEQLSYRRLNVRVNQLAHYLRRLGVKPEARVGVLMERSADIIVAVLAVLKAGGTYVPVDPSYPQQRISFMLSDARARLVLTQKRLLEAQPRHEARAVCMDAEWDVIAEESCDNPSRVATPDNAAYMIYTSGSTGLPKAVTIQHASLASYTEFAAGEFTIEPADRVLQFASISFDAAAEEIFPTLARGATLVLRSGEMISSATQFIHECEQLGLTVLDLPTAYWHLLITELAANGLRLPERVRLVIIGGESALPEKVSIWHQHVGGHVRLLNTYGPTEATIVTTMGDLSDPATAFTAGGGIPIGTAIGGTQTYVLDQFLQPVPAGVPGELCVGGRHLARGYFNNPDKTAEKFIPHPFTHEHGARLYKTGDRVRYLSDGRIEFLGRMDGQIKIRGFRIETGEIEAVLSQHPGVKECAVVVNGNAGEKRLAAYVVATHHSATLVSDLRDFLKDGLPQYMIPAAFILMDKLPLTPNGKLDRRALPALEHARSETLSTYVAPRTAVEEILVGIFSEVLKVQDVGINDNFFELGGHSLLATQVILRVQKAFSIAVPLRALFEHPTIAELAGTVQGLAVEGQVDAGLHAITRQSVSTQRELAELDQLTEDELTLFAQRSPLSFAQQRLWFLDRLEPGDPLYNLYSAVRLKGHLDLPALEKTFSEVIARHDALRTVFPAFDGRPLQIVTPPQPFNLPVIDLSGVDEEEREARVRQLAAEEAFFRFDLSEGPLCRVTLLRLAPQEHVVLLTLHHIISDGWSMNVLVREIVALYEAFSNGRPSPLAELPIQYADYARWQREWLQGEVLERQLDYWKRQLAGSPPVLELPTDRPRPAVRTHQGANFSFRVGREVSEALAALSRREGVTPFMTLLAAFQVLLQRYTRQEDIPVGTAIAGRTRVETEALIGFFVNTLVLRTDLSGDPTFTELLGRAREVTLGAYAHQDIPFEKLVEELQPERSASHTPLFQVMLVLQNTPDESKRVEGLRLEELMSENRSAKFDLMLMFSEGREGLTGTFEYSVDLFDEATVRRMAGHFERLLEGLVANPEERIGRLAMLSEREREELLNMSRPTGEFRTEACIHHLFEQQAAQNPDRVAVSFEGAHLTYGELNERANQLAHHLLSLDLSTDSPVALLLEPSMHTVVSLLAVLKAGLAYLPLDTAYPQERLSFMLADAGAQLLLTTSGLRESLPGNHPRLLLLDTDASISAQSAENCAAAVSADDVAYVIYTSGSTGRPKGVAVTHRNVVRLFAATEASYGFNSSDVWTLFHSYAFDFSVWEVWGALLSGGRLVVVPFLVSREPERFWRLVVEERVTVLNQTPSAFRQLARVDEQRQGIDELSLRLVIFGGEALELQSLRGWFEKHGDERPLLVNMYGITETTVHVTYRPIRRADVLASRGSVIGVPISDMQLYVLDPHMEPVPFGVVGELYVGGAGGARGYLNRPGLTAERFVPDPFAGEAGVRLYRTGDLARRLADGELEYIGRCDEQVKVRGFRIELGEIEATLAQHAKVSGAVVVAREDVPGEKRIVAYVAAQGEQDVTTSELRSYLKEKLPEYMVPAAFVNMEMLPLTPNGKIDRRALPAADYSLAEMDGTYVAPRDMLELQLSRVWEEVLNIQPVGVKDNFFEIGGHSLSAVRLMTRISHLIGNDVPLAALFQAPTIENLASLIRRQATFAGASTLVGIQKEGSRQPFFCVHPVGGNVFSYVSLAHHLGAEQPLYGLQAQGLNEGETPLARVEEMAAHYVESLRAVQPEGPYTLAGWSMGGLVAFEMARQLEAEGESVSRLLLFDVDAPSAYGALPEQDEDADLLSFAQDLGLSLTGDDLAPFEQIEPDERLSHLLQHARAASIVPPDITPAQARRLFNVFKMNLRALREYVAQSYGGSLELFLAVEGAGEEEFKERASEWGALARGGVELRTVPGNHYTMWREPHVGVLAGQVKAILEEAQGRAPEAAPLAHA